MATHNAHRHPADHELLLAADAMEERDERAGRAARTAVEWHVEGCAACRARLDALDETLREATEAYRLLSEGDDAPAVSGEFAGTAASAPSASPVVSMRPGSSMASGAFMASAASMASERARLAGTLAAMPAPRRSWWQSVSPMSIAVLPPWSVAAAAVVVLGLIAPWTAWMTPSDGISAGAGAGAAQAALARELPAANLTPGAAAPVVVGDLCAGHLPSRVVTAELRDSVLRAYGMEHAAAETYELDALITPELGGTTDARNLWPQRYASLVWHARVKDVLEEKLAADVCAGRLDLLTAQRDLATDWVAAYRRYFQSDVPLQTHLAPRFDEPELEIAAPRPPSASPAPLVTLQVLLVWPNSPSFPSSTRSAGPSRFDPRRTS